MATYPTAVKSFTSRLDILDDVDASDINAAYDEITAVQATLGASPAKSLANYGSLWNGSSGYNWSTVKARLDNIERGVAGDAHPSLYVHQNGGDTVQATSTSVVPLTVRGALNAASPLFAVQDGSGVNRVHVDPSTGQVFQTGNPVPYITKCGLATLVITSGAASATASVTCGDFSVSPYIVTTINSSDTALRLANTLVRDVTSTGFTIDLFVPSSVAVNTTVRIFWVAVQGLRTGSSAAIP